MRPDAAGRRRLLSCGGTAYLSGLLYGTQARSVPGGRPVKDEVRAWGRVGGWVIVILAATTVPLPASGPPGWLGELPLDRVAHAGLYGGLGWIAADALRRTGRWSRLALFTALGCGMVFAAADELHQHWIPGRTPELGDWTADVVGLAAGLLVALVRRER